MQTFLPWITVSTLALINALFAWKYGSRIDGGAFGAALIIAVSVCPLLLFLLCKSERILSLRRLLQSKLTTAALIAGLVAAALVFFRLYPQERLRVDRYEMIRLFWDNAFSHRCPYCPRSEGTNIPGPFPFYFYAAFPFYLMGELGWYSLAGFLLFAGMVAAAKDVVPRLKNRMLLLLVTSPAFLFEIACRSTNFLNGSLLLFCTLLIYRMKQGGRKRVLTSGVVAGLALSTRSLAFLTIALAVVFTFKRQLFSRRVFAMSAVAGAVFLLTFVPVIAMCGRKFFVDNPFVVQAALAPPLLMVGIAVGAFVLAYRCGSIYTLHAINGGVFIALVGGYAAEFIFSQGLTTAIFGSSIDVSYFTLAMPFLLMGLGEGRGNPAGSSTVAKR